eukprot:3340308-Pyramimonas_sp.AAC.1
MGDPEDLGGGWYKYIDAEERPYYYNTITEVTQWERPEDLGEYDQEYDEEEYDEGDGEEEEDDEDDDDQGASAFADMYIRDTDQADIV